MRHSHPLLFVGIALLIIVLAAACTPGPAGDLPVTREGPEATGTPGPPQATTTPEPYPPPTQTLDPVWQLTIAAQMTESAPQPTETPAPTTTLVPTPAITPMPTAAPPIIPLAEGQAPAPFTILYRQGNVLRLIDSDGRNDRLLVDVQTGLGLSLVVSKAGGSLEWISPSPDGKQLALGLINAAEPRQPEFAVYLFDMATAELRLLVEDGTAPSWSPDGKRIAYRDGHSQGLWLVDLATGQSREVYAVELDSEQFVSQIGWSPDGRHLLFLLNKSQMEPMQIMTWELDAAEPAMALWSSLTHPPRMPQWSPDGSKILFVSPAGKYSGPSAIYNLWLMNPDGTGQVQLTQNVDVIPGGAPSWSPDGRWVAFSGTPFFEESAPLNDLWLIDSSANLMRLTSNHALRVNESVPVWSPDNSQLVFYREGTEIWVMSFHDGNQMRLPLVPSDLADVVYDIIILPGMPKSSNDESPEYYPWSPNLPQAALAIGGSSGSLREVIQTRCEGQA